MNLSDNRPKVGRVKNDCLGRLRRFGGMAVREDGKITGNGRWRFSGAVSGCAASGPESDARTRRLGGVVGKTGRGSCEGAGRSVRVPPEKCRNGKTIRNRKTTSPNVSGTIGDVRYKRSPALRRAVCIYSATQRTDCSKARLPGMIMLPKSLMSNRSVKYANVPSLLSTGSCTVVVQTNE